MLCHYGLYQSGLHSNMEKTDLISVFVDIFSSGRPWVTWSQRRKGMSMTYCIITDELAQIKLQQGFTCSVSACLHSFA